VGTARSAIAEQRSDAIGASLKGMSRAQVVEIVGDTWDEESESVSFVNEKKHFLKRVG
jgi:hypothetical protein